MSKLVYIVLDGVNANWGWKYLGYINHLMEQNLGGAYTVRAELPTMSRPFMKLYKVVWSYGSTVSLRTIPFAHLKRKIYLKGRKEQDWSLQLQPIIGSVSYTTPVLSIP